jgi:tRNA threonylcarbamoyladenosine biosynthesis protein TsaB
MNFIALQGTYSSLEFGFFGSQGIGSVAHYDELRASSNLVPFLEEFLSKNRCTLDALSFIAVDKGPGAFTSLRATIASINGVAFARKIPLIGVNSLEALQVQACAYEQAKSVRFVAALLNAYNNDVYCRIFDQQTNSLVDESCQKIDTLINQLIALGTPVLCIGNGVTIYQNDLEQGLASSLKTILPNPATPAAAAIGQIALAEWKKSSKQDITYSIEPYYLKTQLFAIKR